MILSLKNLTLAAALALGSSATNAVPVPRAQAEHEVQVDGGNVKFLRAAALQGQEVQRDAIPFLDDKPSDQNPGDEPFVGRQLPQIKCTGKEGDQCFRNEKNGCCVSSDCLFLAEDSDQGFCEYARAWNMCNENLPCRPSDGCLLPNDGAAKVCIEGAGRVARLAGDQEARIEALETADSSRLSLNNYQDDRIGTLEARIGVIEDPEERIGTLETRSRDQEALIGTLEALVGTLEARIEALEGVDAANLIQDRSEALETRIEALELVPDLSVSEARAQAVASREINELSAPQFIDLIRHSGGPGQAALLGARTDASDVINQLDESELANLISQADDVLERAILNQLPRYKFLNLIRESDEAGRAVLTGARSNYTEMFSYIDLTASRLPIHLSDWEIPANAIVKRMFKNAFNIPDLSRWTLTDEWDSNLNPTGARMYMMLEGTDSFGMSVEMCPCINGKQCCPGAFGHGPACENAQTECVRSTG